MEENLNYPIKYAVLELKINKGYESNYEDVTFGYIVSKCYVTNQNIKYFHDGTHEQTYEVVFPYKDIHTFKYSTLLRENEFNEKAQTPIYSLNDTTVSMIFNTYEEAAIFKEQANNNFKRSIFMNYGTTNKAKTMLNEFKENQQICEKYEKIILEKNKHMTITSELLNTKKLILK